MLAGQPPFRGETPLSIAVQHVRSQPVRLETQRPELPSGLCRLVHKLLAKEPEHRYQHPREVLRELRALHVDGEAAAEDSDIYDADELATPVSLSGSTDQLSQLMRTQSLMVDNRPWWRYALVASLAAFALGALVAYAMRNPFVLADQGGAGGIDDKATAGAQYEYAISRDTPAAWQAVIDYYPDDEGLRWQAKRQLAGLYLQRDELDLAMPLFEELATKSKETRFRAFGLAGQCVVLYIQESDALLNVRLEQLQDLTRPLNDEEKREILDEHMVRLIEAIEGDKSEQSQSANQEALRRILKSLNVPGEKANKE